MRTKWLLAAAVIFGFTGTSSAQSPTAESFPDRPIRVIAPFSPGASDSLLRLVQPNLGKILGQSVVIENRPGASGAIASELVANSAPDGYTLVLGTITTHAMNPLVRKTLPYDPQSDFKPVALLALMPLVLTVHPSVPADNVGDLVKWLKVNGNKASYGSSAAGGPLHLIGEMFKQMADVDAVHVPFQGSAPAHAALVGGHIDFMFDSLTVTNASAEAGTVRRIATPSAQRVRAAPSLPLMSEQGFPLEVYSWVAIFAPAGTPPEIAEKLGKAFSTAVNDPTLADRMNGLGVEVVESSPMHLEAFLKDEIHKWGKVIESAKLTLD